MIAKIQKWLNGSGLRLAVLNLLANARRKAGDKVDIAAQNKTMVIIVSPVKKIGGRHTIEELAARMPEDHEKNESDWGSPVGREVW